MVELLRSPRTTAALTTAGAGLIAIAFTAQQLIGWPGYVAALVLLDLLSGRVPHRPARGDRLALGDPADLATRLPRLDRRLGVLERVPARDPAVDRLPVALVTLVGVFIGLSRDTIQIIRSIGDVLRAVLVTSIVLETLSGIILDSPLRALNIEGELAYGGPISGLVSTRNHLGLLAAIAVVTFAIEWRTKSITRYVAIPSLALAVGTMVFTGSPVVAMVAVVLFAAAAVLYGIRRMPAARRQFAQYSVLALLGARGRVGLGVPGADHRALQRDG